MLRKHQLEKVNSPRSCDESGDGPCYKDPHLHTPPHPPSHNDSLSRIYIHVRLKGTAIVSPRLGRSVSMFYFLERTCWRTNDAEALPLPDYCYFERDTAGDSWADLCESRGWLTNGCTDYFLKSGIFKKLRMGLYTCLFMWCGAAV